VKKRLIFAALLLGSTSMARADEISDLKALSEKLMKQNQALAAKLEAVEKRQHKIEAQVASKPKYNAANPNAVAADGSLVGQAQFTAADLTRRLLSPTDDSTFTFHGITIYGGLDVGFGYQTHGTPLSAAYGPGIEEVISKNSNHTYFGFVPSGLSQSNIGIKGVEEFTPGWSAVFNLNTAINPQSGWNADNLRALTQQNGVAAANQISGGDSSRAGQAFSGAAYAGVSSPVWGTLTFGRQNSLGLDDILAYDPMGGAYAFSPLGYQGGFAGNGVTQDARLDESLKYRVNYGPFRAALMYKFNSIDSEATTAYQGQLGFDWMGLSVDAVASKINSAVSASALGTSLTAQGGIGTVTPALLTGVPGLVNATVSDNTSFIINGKYKINQFTLYAGYENTRFANPQDPIFSGASTVGGYGLLSVNNNAFTINKDVQSIWGGVKYAVRPNIDITLAAYYEISSTFGGSNVTSGPGTAAAANLGTVGCLTTAAANCRGEQVAVSGLVDYRFTKRFDVYGGAMWSSVRNGLASGFVSAGAVSAGTFDPVVGARFQF